MPRPKADRSEEVSTILKNLEYCNISKLKEVIAKAQKLIKEKKNDEIKEYEKQIKELQDKIAELKKPENQENQQTENQENQQTENQENQ